MDAVNEDPPRDIILNVKFIKGSEPILIDDEEKRCKYDGYPPGYNKVFEYIYPPVEWMEDGMKWRRVASTEPADRNHVIALAQDLKSNLSYWHARMHGVCLVRRELYTQCFNELIRQVCVNSIDRGELLIKIRNEYNASITAHKRLFESGLIFRIKHTTLDDHKDDVTEKDIQDIEDEHVKLKKKLVDANNKYNILKIDLKKELNNLKDANQHELNFFNRNHKALKDQLDLILSMNT
ncbi:33 kDa inner dynein arm light chain, axonemal-like [Metopolophium dirhodum]|uniref:33 kDa inner dynein arm light chain, axonemal-like n=1 Tax=Metopolophium dirhodum TaxID=44670 RepID=UPI0029906A49|nr:33 kDa inner dynein arm light chain, axonemal-like [Metopolophium dirhodum]